MPKTRKIRVNLRGAPRSYDIVIKDNIIKELGPRLSGLGFRGSVALITNPKVKRLYAGVIIKSLASAGFKTIVITVPDGERYKTLDEAAKIFDALVKNRFERGSPIVALGGGVIGDISGFAASAYLRGVPYIQVPTTLLAQVDSSVGGKTGVNHPRGKNLIGAFYQPAAVYIDPLTLKTLPEREFKAGLSEVIKYGVIKDRAFFGFLERNAAVISKRGPAICAAIEKSCALKAWVVSRDERESGLRAILNFGHTFGHATEAASGYGTFLHGEAISIGMVMAMNLSVSLGLCPAKDAQRVAALISAMGLLLDAPKISHAKLIDAMRLDKKVSGGKMRFVLPRAIGRVIVKDVTVPQIRRFLGSLDRA
ncbi:MAG: 3-dehydroquinate synthase [Deltaproteobacteria bacterium]|nr:3-dehydroquinate synthase [Deltaproteobacteria bacterium]